MRIIVTGSESIDDYAEVETVIDRSGFNPTTILTGTSLGTDELVERFSYDRCLNIEIFPFDWAVWGAEAINKRNLAMVNSSDGLIIIYDRQSDVLNNLSYLAQKILNRIHIHKAPFKA